MGFGARAGDDGIPSVSGAIGSRFLDSIVLNRVVLTFEPRSVISSGPFFFAGF